VEGGQSALENLVTVTDDPLTRRAGANGRACLGL